jgi:hypothetical protein
VTIHPHPLPGPNRQQDDLRRQWQREEEEGRQAEAEFIRRQNEQIRRQQGAVAGRGASTPPAAELTALS